MRAATDIQPVLAALRGHERFVVTAHENPDGDALGSLLATHLALGSMGKDSVMVLGGAAPLPGEYHFLDLAERGLLRETPPDHNERVLIAVDCANESRIVDTALLADAPLSVNIDHHHDNSLFADVNLVVSEASSTGELLADVLRALGVDLTSDIAEALYVALVTDTGRFQYTNTTPKTLRLAADLVEAGADVHKVFQGVYETVQFAKLKLLARALDRAQVFEGGRIVVSYLVRTDFAEVGAVEPYSEGIIDYLRAVEGAELAALIREPPREGSPERKVSLRSSVDELDVSAIARMFGGGGHRQAAGFGTDLSIDEITARIVAGAARDDTR
jgi:bifunctional oligoribonuclease and PAP phosphatase NrnA